jgi:hypothetical protein
VDLDRRLAELAARQHGLITLQQAIHLGATSRQIRWRISTGVLTVVRRNVYRFAGVPRTWHQSVLAAVLSCGSGVLARHRPPPVWRPGRSGAPDRGVVAP